MNYEPNTVDWSVRDVVIHDADAKEHHMLMVVTGIDAKNGLWYCHYLFHPEWNDYVGYANDKKYLHNPRKFGLIIPNGI